MQRCPIIHSLIGKQPNELAANSDCSEGNQSPHMAWRPDGDFRAVVRAGRMGGYLPEFLVLGHRRWGRDAYALDATSDPTIH